MPRWFAVLALFFTTLTATAQRGEPPPEPQREFRASWVATLGNIDWPSRAGLTANDQKAEFRAILERAVELKLNAIVLQVRAAGDAFYESKDEPWSAALTGTMGQAPGYDPLAFAISEAHTRGMELHAWFNPYRALPSTKSEVPDGHISRRHRDWVREFEGQLWLDPGDAQVRDYAVEVILDVVRRYDVDGVQLDAYFYPYPSPRKTPFPDEATYRIYRDGGGKLGRDDWRRHNNDLFVQRLYERVKETKRWVKVGLSPTGVWRPGNPESIVGGIDAYGQLYADSRKWLTSGWCDYFAPQLYGGIAPRRQSFPVLLQWWAQQNPLGRHLWPGIATERIGPARPPSEIVNQIAITRELAGSHGHIHWNHKALLANRGKIVELLRAQTYEHLALVPASPWLGESTLPRPTLETSPTRISWQLPGGQAPKWWLFQARLRNDWAAQLVPGTRTSGPMPSADAIAVRAVDATGNLGEATTLELR